MAELFSKLGIDWRIFIAQLVNFAILFVVLTKFLWRPVTRMLAERAQKIARGLADARDATEKLASAETTVMAMIDSAKAESAALIEKAELEAQVRTQRALELARLEAHAVVERTKVEIAVSAAEAVTLAKAELGVIVLAALERVLGKTAAGEIDRSLIEEAVTIMKRTK